MNENYLNELEQLLSRNDAYTVENKVNKNKVAELAHKYDPELIDLLAGNAGMRRLFFVETAGKALVFNKDKFIQFISNKEFLPDSYTSYKNKIGLGVGTELLAENKELVLNWPYKDCVLEGGQDKEDAKRDEVFFNEVLAPEQIDRLLDEKVLTGWKRYDKDGEHEVKDFADTDNLIIRGNNLLALHSLKRRYSGKVKLIYIDPPYNTGSDTFGYNDKFNHSTWLTFMRNRLEVAWSLLDVDGFIAVQVDDNENAYLKVLLDEIFGRDNYRNSVYWHRTYAGKTVSKNMPWNVDTILLYSKNDQTNLNNITAELTDKDKASFTKDDHDGRGLYNTVSLQKTASPGPQTTYDYVDNEGRLWKCPVKGWRMTQAKLKALENDNRLYITDKTIREKYYLNERTEIGKQIDNFWGDIGNMNRSSDKSYDLGGQKPEKLIQRIIMLTTTVGDIVLDYHLGSGTTAATALKMGRQFIGAEQLDYGDTDSVKRLRNVISGDDTGISKDIDWQGGGSFVYAHLMDLGNKFIEKVKKANTDKELEDLLKQASKSSFLSYKVDPAKINPADHDFTSLSMAHKKQLLLELVDQNHLYVNYTEIDDADYGVSTNDKRLNKQFYEK
ncbi:MAG TPA: site-specific DNA-methyltransferase [Candidatus Saccharimonadales bacterium]|nr:site-specific DNA-methyltransferase [Candidatus Saccharimonadales bacterium]